MECATPVAHHQQTEQTNFKIGARKTLFLEQYVALLHSSDYQNLTAVHLNQIVSIHGFKQFKRKKSAEEAVRGIKLIDPARSTLNESISSSKGIVTIEEVIKDLTALNWQECSVTSFKSISSENYSKTVQIPSTKTTKSKTLKSKKRPRLSTPTKSLSYCSGPSKSTSCSSKKSDSGSSSVSMLFEGSGDTQTKRSKRKKFVSLKCQLS